MAKKSAILRNNKVKSLSDKLKDKREKLCKIANNLDESFEDRLVAIKKLSELPRNSSKVRIRNRCEVSGRPHGVYRKLRISRIALRDMASAGKIPGITKSSW